MTKTESRRFDMSVDMVYGYCRYALTTLGYRIERADSVFNTLTGVKYGLLSLGDSTGRMDVKVDPSGPGKCVVEAKAYNKNGFGVPDVLYFGGQGDIDKFWRQLAAILNRERSK